MLLWRYGHVTGFRYAWHAQRIETNARQHKQAFKDGGNGQAPAARPTQRWVPHLEHVGRIVLEFLQIALARGVKGALLCRRSPCRANIWLAGDVDIATLHDISEKKPEGHGNRAAHPRDKGRGESGEFFEAAGRLHRPASSE